MAILATMEANWLLPGALDLLSAKDCQLNFSAGHPPYVPAIGTGLSNPLGHSGVHGITQSHN